MPIYKNYLESAYEESIHTITSILLDVSGGRGKYIKNFEVVPIDTFVKQGFAGGITPDNCIEVVRHIEENLPSNIDYWIDMESGVRDENNWFSVDKCRQVCEKVYEYLQIK